MSQDVLNILKDLVQKGSSESEENINLIFDRLKEEFDKTTQNSLLEVINKMAEKLYLIRCSIAHLKYKHNHFEFEDSKWDIVVYTTLKIIEELYDLYGRRLEGLN